MPTDSDYFTDGSHHFWAPVYDGKPAPVGRIYCLTGDIYRLRFYDHGRFDFDHYPTVDECRAWLAEERAAFGLDEYGRWPRH